MRKHIRNLGVVLAVVLGLCVLTGVRSPAEAVIIVRSAAVQNGVAVVEGGNAARNAPISWEGALVTQANNGGNFAFQGGVPVDCVGRLEDGVPADAVDVALANCAPVSEAPVPQTGQTTSYAPGDDGDLQAGIPWPSPRFTDHGNGTVTDHLTGLIWLQQADCVPVLPWAQALSDVSTLASGRCSLTDGSMPGDWRVPNVNELRSLINAGTFNPALPAGHPFSGVASAVYWSSTTHAGAPGIAWVVALSDGNTFGGNKDAPNRAWPVRGGN